MADTAQQIDGDLKVDAVFINPNTGAPLPKLDPEFKAAWLEELRNGGHAQGKGTLHATPLEGDDELCCLGVACVVGVRQGLVEPQSNGTGNIRYGTAEEHEIGDYGVGTLPESMIILIDDEHKTDIGSNPRVPNPRLDYTGDDPRVLDLATPEAYPVVSLAELNDAGFSFEEIADVIEKHL